MSYILEALRRAERERAQGQATGTDAPGGAASPAANRGPILKLVVALLAINALVLIVMLVRHKSEPAANASAASAPSASAAPAVRVATPTPSAPITAPAPAPVDEVAGQSDDAVVQEGVSSMDDLGATGDTDEAAPQEAPQHVEHQLPRGSVTFAKKPLTGAVKPPPPPDPENDSVEAANEESDTAAAAEPASAEEPQQVASAQPVTQPAAPSAALPAGTSVKALSDMSAAYQAQFPHFTMEVHVYDPSPQRRFAMIDGKRYHEGDSLAQGPRLVHIVPEGLVLDFRNERVLYPIGRH